ncbi:MAG: zf-TFIIB domain-containing protein [Thermoplasmatota archaeon]
MPTENQANEIMIKSERTCPRCGVELYIVERGGEKLDICRDCGGIFFDPTELDDVMGAGSPVELLVRITDSLKGENLSCPDCRMAMTTKEVYGVYLDFCPDCQGIWLDRGETEKVWEMDERMKHPFNMQEEEIDSSKFWSNFKKKYQDFGTGEG